MPWNLEELLPRGFMTPRGSSLVGKVLGAVLPGDLDATQEGAEAVVVGHREDETVRRLQKRRR